MDAKAMKIGCGRYIQDPGAVCLLGEEIHRLNGHKALIITGRNSWQAAGAQVEKSLRDADIAYCRYALKGGCTYETLDELVNHVLPEQKTDIVVGVGGGKVMDTAKATAKRAGQPIINLPTSVATFSCWSPLSVMYYENKRPRDRIWHDTEIDCLLIDTKILSEAPSRLFAAGMADSLAKYIETNLMNPANTVDTLPHTMYASKTMARITNEIVLNKGEKAYRDNQNHIISEEFNACVFANVVTTSIAAAVNYSNALNKKIDNGVPFAHSLYYAVRDLFSEEAKDALHGEIVGLGLRASLAIYKRSEFEINNFCRFLDSIGQPGSLQDLGIEPTEKNIQALTESCMVVWSYHPDWHKPVIYEALQRIKG